MPGRGQCKQGGWVGDLSSVGEKGWWLRPDTGGRGKQVDDVAVNIFVHDFCDHLNISVGLIPRRGITVSEYE